MSHPICPRCTGPIPNESYPGQYPGAISRNDNQTEICSACGVEEAIAQHAVGRLEPMSEWPMTELLEQRSLVGMFE